MKVVTQYPDGVFAWIDLATPDIEGAKAFYSGLFGWDIDDRPIDTGGFYSMGLIEGKSVAGMGQMQPEQVAQGVPAYWTSYVKHDNVDAVAARIGEAGGTILLPPMDVMGEGRMLIAQDPAGAIFGVWQPRAHIGAHLVNAPNTLVWNELQTRDLERARTFYSAVFGWTDKADESGYVMCLQDERMHAGMMAMDESWSNVPPNWAVYFLVEDLEAAVDRAGELGGNVLVPPTAAGEMGKFAVVQDPQGGVFSLIHYYGPADPPPGH